MSRGGFWPDEREERLLQACFSRTDAVHGLLRDLLLPHQWNDLDPDARRLLPLLTTRRPDELPELLELGQRTRLALWSESRRRLASAASIDAVLREHSIGCLWLKGVALILGGYSDPGCRAMGDVDFLVSEQNLERAAGWLLKTGWTAEDGMSPREIASATRVGHAWQFHRKAGDQEQSCDLHWRPVLRCYSPEVASLFWGGAVEATLEGSPVRIPCRTDQLFHTCVHGLEWSGTSRIRWVSDALTLLEAPEEIDWERLDRLTAIAEVNARMSRALRYLREKFQSAVPPEMPDRLEARQQRWERRECDLFEKPIPLGLADSISWHRIQFGRIRRHDERWSRLPLWRGFPEYLRLFLRIPHGASLVGALWKQARSRHRRSA